VVGLVLYVLSFGPLVKYGETEDGVVISKSADAALTVFYKPLAYCYGNGGTPVASFVNWYLYSVWGCDRPSFKL